MWLQDSQEAVGRFSNVFVGLTTQQSYCWIFQLFHYQCDGWQRGPESPVTWHFHGASVQEAERLMLFISTWRLDELDIAFPKRSTQCSHQTMQVHTQFHPWASDIRWSPSKTGKPEEDMATWTLVWNGFLVSKNFLNCQVLHPCWTASNYQHLILEILTPIISL